MAEEYRRLSIKRARTLRTQQGITRQPTASYKQTPHIPWHGLSPKPQHPSLAEYLHRRQSPLAAVMTSSVSPSKNLATPLKGRTVKSLTENWDVTWRYLVSDSQLRRTGPEKGAVVNALWDLWAK